MNTSTSSSFSTIFRLLTLASVLLLALPAPAQVSDPALRGGEASFVSLGDLPPNPSWFSNGRGVSNDGTVVVGNGDNDNDVNAFEAFRWTEDGGMVGLGFLQEDMPGSRADAVSADGSVIVGTAAAAAGQEGWRWTEAEGMVGLGSLNEGGQSIATGISGDGSVIVGTSTSDSADLVEAYRWTEAEGIVGLGDLPGGLFYSEGWDASADGSVIVGQGATATDGTVEAFRWTEAGGMQGLGDLPGGLVTSQARAVSADGSVVVGTSNTDRGFEAFRWEDGEMVGIGELPTGGFNSDAHGVSADGSVIVGDSFTEEGLPQTAFIWTQEDGMRSVKEVLENDYGLDLTGWTLSFAWDVSDDGTIIVGQGKYTESDPNRQEAFRAVIPRTIADEATPEALADVLSAPSPNPARGTSTFTIAVEQGQHVAVEVFDVMGRHVQTVYEGALAAGMSETLTLDASTLPAGIYLIRATGEDFSKTRRVTVVR